MSDVEKGKAGPRPWLRRAFDEILQGGGRLERLWEELTGSGRRAWLHEIVERTHGADALYEHQAGADVRDTQNRGPGHLTSTRAEWNAFVETTLHSHR